MPVASIFLPFLPLLFKRVFREGQYNTVFQIYDLGSIQYENIWRKIK